MLVPPINPHAASLMATQLQQRNLTPTPPVKAVTGRPAMPNTAKEKTDPRDKRDRDREGDAAEWRGSKTDFSV